MKPHNISYDPIRKKTYVSGVREKAKILAELDPDTMAITPVRTITAPPNNVFWVRDGVAVFWQYGSTMAFSLDDPKAKAKTFKAASERDSYNLHVAFAPEPRVLHAVKGEEIHRFDGDRWTPVDALPDTTIVRATLKGVFVRTTEVWKPLFEEQTVRATVSISGDRALLANYGGSVVIGLDGSSPTRVKVGNWCSIGHAGGFFAWQDNTVLAIDFDGNVRDTEITSSSEAADRCLFRAGECVYFVQGTKIHRHRDGSWTAHDVKNA